MAASSTTTAVARAVLVFGSDPVAGALLTTINVRAYSAAAPRVCFSGPVRFGDSTRKHIEGVLVPIANRIAGGLGLAPCCFEISAANPGAAAVQDRDASIRGFSADVPVLLGLLAAQLGLPLPTHLVGTGHVSSSGGEIAPVRSLPAKLDAILKDGSLTHCLLPDWDRDPSLQVLTPQECERAAGAIAVAKERLRVIPVTDVADLIERVFEPAQVVLASLKRGFFGCTLPSAPVDGIERAVAFLLADGEQRFWAALERHLRDGAKHATRELLATRVRYQVARREYPPGFGRRLFRLLAGLPPALRRLKTEFPLLAWRQCAELGRWAGENDYEDVVCLQEAALGKHLDRPAGPVAPGHTKVPTDATLATVCAQISAETLAACVDRVIDAARASYPLDTITADTSDEFLDVVTAFTIHLLRRSGSLVEPVEREAAEASALQLLEAAFPGEGGFKAASNEARLALRGGLRFVLDAMANQYRKQQRENHVNRVLIVALRARPWREKLDFIRGLLDRLGPELPADLRAADPAEFADGCEELARAYVASLDHVHAVLRKY
jgi:hypothetical protein